MMRPLQRLFRMLSKQDYHDFGALYRLAHHRREGGAESPVDIPSLFGERARREENKLLLEELAEEDMPRDEVERRERASFGSSARDGYTERLAVARKLTLAAEMNEKFVADSRVWRWVEDALTGAGEGAPE